MKRVIKSKLMVAMLTLALVLSASGVMLALKEFSVTPITIPLLGEVNNDVYLRGMFQVGDLFFAQNVGSSDSAGESILFASADLQRWDAVYDRVIKRERDTAYTVADGIIFTFDAGAPHYTTNGTEWKEVELPEEYHFRGNLGRNAPWYRFSAGYSDADEEVLGVLVSENFEDWKFIEDFPEPEEGYDMIPSRITFHDDHWYIYSSFNDVNAAVGEDAYFVNYYRTTEKGAIPDESPTAWEFLGSQSGVYPFGAISWVTMETEEGDVVQPVVGNWPRYTSTDWVNWVEYEYVWQSTPDPVGEARNNMMSKVNTIASEMKVQFRNFLITPDGRHVAMYSGNGLEGSWNYESGIGVYVVTAANYQTIIFVSDDDGETFDMIEAAIFYDDVPIEEMVAKESAVPTEELPEEPENIVTPVEEPEEPEFVILPVDELVATPTASTVLINGEDIAFEAYLIEGSNYFKLRDLAFVLMGSEKEFAVGWDGENNAISLTSGEEYEPSGSEMASGAAEAKIATPTGATVYVDGEEVLFIAYHIEGNNFFMLRDIGRAFDFYVGWDGELNTIVVDTTLPYD